MREKAGVAEGWRWWKGDDEAQILSALPEKEEFHSWSDLISIVMCVLHRVVSRARYLLHETLDPGHGNRFPKNPER